VSIPGTSSINNQPLIGGGQVASTGMLFFCNSTAPGASDDATHGFDPLTPFRTLAFAIGQCSNDRGDTIFLGEGHQELIQAAAAVNLNARGVHIVGLGQGRNRPLLQWASSPSASLVFNAASITLENVQMQMTVANGVTGAIVVQQTDCTIRNCELVVSDGLGAAVLGLVTTLQASRLLVEDCVFRGIAQAGTTAFVRLVGTPDGIVFNRCEFVGQTVSGLIWNDVGSLVTNLRISDCLFRTLAGTPAIVLNSAVTGTLRWTLVQGTNLTGIIVPASCAIDNVITYNESTPGVQPIVFPGSGTRLPAGRSLVDELVGASLNAGRQQSFTVTADFTNAAWNTVGTHEIVAVNGAVRLRIVPIVTAMLTSGGAATLQFGTAASTSVLIGPTVFSDLQTDRYWLTATPDPRFAFAQIIDQIVSNMDVGYEIVGAAMTAGAINFQVWWEAISAGGSTAQTGGGVSL
jgi:hypothetical protein